MTWLPTVSVSTRRAPFLMLRMLSLSLVQNRPVRVGPVPSTVTTTTVAEEPSPYVQESISLVD
jgi:hypothetical protein